MTKAELHIVEFINDAGSKIPVLAQCTLCPYPKVFFDTRGNGGQSRWQRSWIASPIRGSCETSTRC